MVKIECAGFMIGCTAMMLAGCSAKVGPHSGAVEQAAKISRLQGEVARLEIELEDVQGDLAGAEPVDSNLDRADLRTLPFPRKLVTARGSVVRREGTGEILRWRIRSEDSRSRFLQVAGPATIDAIALDQDGDAIDLGHWSIDQADWRNGLREGLMGTAYAMDLPLDGSLPEGAQIVLARITLEDPRLDEPLQFESEIPILRPRNDPEARP
jgi:hypothetical protein